MIVLILEALFVAIIGGILYSIIGIIPGTDETATMAPITLVLVLLGLPPVIIFAWFVGILVAMQITHTVPTAMASLPGSTMAVPMVHYCAIAKKLGIPHIAIKKMAAGSLLGSIVALPIAVAFAGILAPLGDQIKPYIGIIFTLGAVLIAYMSKAKLGAVIALIPMAFLIQGVQRIANESLGKNLFISIFMGITIGPMISEIFSTFIPKFRHLQSRDKINEIYLAPDGHKAQSLYPNPMHILTKGQSRKVAVASAVSGATFTLSPVGMTVLLGEFVAGRSKEVYDKTTTTLAVQDAVSNATYMGELIIPLLAFGLPLSPVALGPAMALFNAPPVFSIDPINNLHTMLSWWQYLVFGVVGIIGGSLFAYPIAIHKSRAWSKKLFEYFSHEALIGSFIGLIFMLSFYEAGILGVFIALTLGMFGGILHNLFNIHTGVQFMSYYASGWIVTNILALATLFK